MGLTASTASQLTGGEGQDPIHRPCPESDRRESFGEHRIREYFVT